MGPIRINEEREEERLRGSNEDGTKTGGPQGKREIAPFPVVKSAG